MFPLYDTNPHRRTPWFTLVIIAINIGVMFWLSKLPQDSHIDVLVHRGFIPQRVRQLSDPQLVVEVELAQEEDDIGLGQPPAAPPVIRLEANQREIYMSMFTMMFLHGGWLHLASNMWFLWIFGNNIEDRLGHLIYLAFYLLGGFFALALHWMIEPNSSLPVIGASGAVAAVLGAYAITYPTAKVRTLFFVGIILILDIPALVVLGLWFGQQLLAGLGILNMGGLDSGVAWWAHVGGFVAGVVLMPLLALGAPPPDEDWKDEVERQFGPTVDDFDDR